MPFRIASGPEVFVNRMHQVADGLHGVEMAAEDFLIYGSGDTIDQAMLDYDQNLISFLEQCQECNIVLSNSKIKLREASVPFIGHVASAVGLGNC